MNARRRRHYWREAVTEAWRCATLTWEAECEATALGYDTETREFALAHPRPRLGDFMVSMSGTAYH